MNENDTDNEPEEQVRKNQDIKPWRLYITGIITGILLATIAVFVGDILNLHPFSRTSAADSIYDLTKTLEMYIDRYYWKADTSDEEFVNMAGKGMVSALGDPFSLYMTREELMRSREKNSGDYIGIGASIAENTQSHRKYVTRIESGWPADKAGLKVGDEIIALDGEDVKKMSVDDMVVIIRGDNKTTRHVLTIIRRDTMPAEVSSGSAADEEEGVKMDITVVTESIVNTSITSKMLENKIGYIKISTFDRETPKQFTSAIAELTKSGAKAFIMDVRNNGGGVLTAVVSMLNRLLPEGTILTETRKGEKDVIYRSDSRESLDMPMVVLINAGSASASEVFAGVLQDRDKAELVGETSYGKGIVQSIFPLSNDQGGIRLTTGEYLLPIGRCIHGVGLTPDREVAFSGTEEDLATDRDEQLRAAIDLLAGK